MLEKEIIYGLQQLSNPVLDFIFQMITHLGDQYVLILLVAVFYWLINKRSAFKLVFTYIFSASLNELIKGFVNRTRPYEEADIRSIGPKTHGSSMPSGHSQASSVISSILYLEYRKKIPWLKWVLLANLILVPLSRMYLGQHYLTDVLVGVIIGVGISIVMSYLVDKMGKFEYVYGLILALILTVYAIIMKDKAYADVKNVFVAAGGFTGFAVGYTIDKLWVDYDKKPYKWTYLYRMLLGIVGILLLYFGLKMMLPKSSLWADYFRYMAIGLWATCGVYTLFKVLKL